MSVHPARHAQCSAFHTTRDQWRRWHLAAFAYSRVAAFIAKLLRRPKRRRAFGLAAAGVGA